LLLEIILNTLLFDQQKTIKAGKFMKITLSKQQKTKKKLENFFSNNKKLSTEKTTL
jgi:phosphoribosylformylglycinamidine (FGAM) synthase PurS component